jgi:hypothetical protein
MPTRAFDAHVTDFFFSVAEFQEKILIAKSGVDGRKDNKHPSLSLFEGRVRSSIV